MECKGWETFVGCDMLCRGDISKLWQQRQEQYDVICVQHHQVPTESVKFPDETQSQYK